MSDVPIQPERNFITDYNSLGPDILAKDSK